MMTGLCMIIPYLSHIFSVNVSARIIKWEQKITSERNQMTNTTKKLALLQECSSPIASDKTMQTKVLSYKFRMCFIGRMTLHSANKLKVVVILV